MSKQFDSITRFLHALDPKSWPRVLGYEARDTEICNSDLSTVSSQADLLLLIDKRWALHLESESSYKTMTGNRLLEYNILAGKALNVPVRSVVILLRPKADGPSMDGKVSRRLPDGTEYLHFLYDIVRVWQIPAERFLESGLGALPFAFISDVDERSLPELVKRAKVRLKRETDTKTEREIWASIRVMMSVKYKPELIDFVLKGLRNMDWEDSVIYMEAVEKGVAKGVAQGVAQGVAKGAVEEARTLLLKLGTKKFGPPVPRELKVLNAIKDKHRLEDLVERTLIVSNWSDLLN